LTQLFGRVAVIGVGMIGASLGRALLSRRIAGEVAGFDTDQAMLETARALGAVSCTTSSLAECVSGAQLTVLATPVGTAVSLLPEVGRLAMPGSMISDVCSTKRQLVQVAEMLPDGVSFVGGHPMAGSEKGGCQALDERLFEQAVYVLTPLDNGDPLALETMQLLVRRLGADPLVLGAEEHDELVGTVSHLPHLAAVALALTVERKTEQREKLLLLAAGGFRDTTRIAMGSPEMWKDICLSNRENIERLLGLYIRELEYLRLIVGDEKALVDTFQLAREFRRQFSAPVAKPAQPE